MDQKAIDRAASAILTARASRNLLEPWSDSDRPETASDGYAIQEAVAARSGLTLAGWKLGCTSETAQKLLGSDGPIVGRVFAERCFESGVTIPDGRPDMLLVEGEFVFEMGANLPPRDRTYSRAEVLDALGRLYPGIELVQSRFRVSRMPVAEMVADNAGHGSLITGPAIAGWRSIDLPAAPVAMIVDGETKATGHGRDVLGDPVEAMVWLANFLSGRGLGLTAGERITTGTCTGVTPLRPGSDVVADFGPLGRVTARFD